MSCIRLTNLGPQEPCQGRAKKGTISRVHRISFRVRGGISDAMILSAPISLPAGREKKWPGRHLRGQGYGPFPNAQKGQSSPASGTVPLDKSNNPRAGWEEVEYGYGPHEKPSEPRPQYRRERLASALSSVVRRKSLGDVPGSVRKKKKKKPPSTFPVGKAAARRYQVRWPWPGAGKSSRPEPWGCVSGQVI